MKKVILSLAFLSLATSLFAMEDPNDLKGTKRKRSWDESEQDASTTDIKKGRFSSGMRRFYGDENDENKEKEEVEEPNLSEEKSTEEATTQEENRYDCELKENDQVFCVQNCGTRPVIMRIRDGEDNDIRVVLVDGPEKINAETISLNSGVRIGIELARLTFPLRIRVFKSAPHNLDIEKIQNPTAEQLAYYKSIGLSDEQTLTEQGKTIVLGTTNLDLSQFKSTGTSDDNACNSYRADMFTKESIASFIAQQKALSLVHDGLGVQAKTNNLTDPVVSHPDKYMKTYTARYL